MSPTSASRLAQQLPLGHSIAPCDRALSCVTHNKQRTTAATHTPTSRKLQDDVRILYVPALRSVSHRHGRLLCLPSLVDWIKDKPPPHPLRAAAVPLSSLSRRLGSARQRGPRLQDVVRAARAAARDEQPVLRGRHAYCGADRGVLHHLAHCVLRTSRRELT